MNFIDVEIGFNKAIYACESGEVRLCGKERLHVPFSQTDETAPCMDGCHIFIVENSNTLFNGGNTFSLAWHPNSFLSSSGANEGSTQGLGPFVPSEQRGLTRHRILDLKPF